ncbi:MAG: glycerate kinase [Oscillospiraceae bacterium]|nr:glycerate kinase [Oscillospiraceae bacterium]
MKKIVLVPDSFKGTMSSEKICEIMQQAIEKHYPDIEVIAIPVADGGEGTVDSFLSAIGGRKINIVVKGPYMEDTESFYGILPDKTAIIEMAAAAGLPMVGSNKQAEKTTTYGVGQLIADAITRGCDNIVVGLGGSATNDLGCGAAAALGVEFLDATGCSFIPTGENLSEIRHIDISKAEQRLRGKRIITMCDIDNPLYGEHGAAYIFGPQKGADEQKVVFLDSQLRQAANTIKSCLQIDVADIKGAGAAGGMGAGMVAFLGAELQMGIEAVLDTVRFDSLIDHANIIFTGEGRIDTQSLRGKVVIGVARRAKKRGIPVVAIVGDISDDIEAAYDEGVSGIFSINRVAIPMQDACKRAESDLYLTMDNILRFMKAIYS